MQFNLLQIWMVKGSAKVVGKVCKCEPQNTDILKLRFYRVKVEIDITQPVATCCFLNRPRTHPRWVAFKYERMPKFCYDCGRIGHERGRCEGGERVEKVGVGRRADSMMILGLDGENIADDDDGFDDGRNEESPEERGGASEGAIVVARDSSGDQSNKEIVTWRNLSGEDSAIATKENFGVSSDNVDVSAVRSATDVSRKQGKSSKGRRDKGRAVAEQKVGCEGERRIKKFVGRPKDKENAISKISVHKEGSVQGQLFTGPPNLNSYSRIDKIVNGPEKRDLDNPRTYKRKRSGLRKQDEGSIGEGDFDCVMEIESEGDDITLGEIISAKVAKRPCRDQ